MLASTYSAPIMEGFLAIPDAMVGPSSSTCPLGSDGWQMRWCVLLDGSIHLYPSQAAACAGEAALHTIALANYQQLQVTGDNDGQRAERWDLRLSSTVVPQIHVAMPTPSPSMADCAGASQGSSSMPRSATSSSISSVLSRLGGRPTKEEVGISRTESRTTIRSMRFKRPTSRDSTYATSHPSPLSGHFSADVSSPSSPAVSAFPSVSVPTERPKWGKLTARPKQLYRLVANGLPSSSSNLSAVLANETGEEDTGNNESMVTSPDLNYAGAPSTTRTQTERPRSVPGTLILRVHGTTSMVRWSEVLTQNLAHKEHTVPSAVFPSHNDVRQKALSASISAMQLSNNHATGKKGAGQSSPAGLKMAASPSHSAAQPAPVVRHRSSASSLNGFIRRRRRSSMELFAKLGGKKADEADGRMQSFLRATTTTSTHADRRAEPPAPLHLESSKKEWTSQPSRNARDASLDVSCPPPSWRRAPSSLSHASHTSVSSQPRSSTGGRRSMSSASIFALTTTAATTPSSVDCGDSMDMSDLHDADGKAQMSLNGHDGKNSATGATNQPDNADATLRSVKRSDSMAHIECSSDVTGQSGNGPHGLGLDLGATKLKDVPTEGRSGTTSYHRLLSKSSRTALRFLTHSPSMPVLQTDEVQLQGSDGTWTMLSIDKEAQMVDNAGPPNPSFGRGTLQGARQMLASTTKRRVPAAGLSIDQSERAVSLHGHCNASAALMERSSTLQDKGPAHTPAFVPPEHPAPPITTTAPVVERILPPDEIIATLDRLRSERLEAVSRFPSDPHSDRSPSLRSQSRSPYPDSRSAKADSPSLSTSSISSPLVGMDQPDSSPHAIHLAMAAFEGSSLGAHGAGRYSTWSRHGTPRSTPMMGAHSLPVPPRLKKKKSKASMWDDDCTVVEHEVPSLATAVVEEMVPEAEPVVKEPLKEAPVPVLHHAIRPRSSTVSHPEPVVKEAAKEVPIPVLHNAVRPRSSTVSYVRRTSIAESQARRTSIAEGQARRGSIAEGQARRGSIAERPPRRKMSVSQGLRRSVSQRHLDNLSDKENDETRTAVRPIIVMHDTTSAGPMDLLTVDQATGKPGGGEMRKSISENFSLAMALQQSRRTSTTMA